MSYWKGLMIAVAIDLVWIMGSPHLVTGPEKQSTLLPMTEWLVNPVPEPPAVVPDEIAELQEFGRVQDSLMVHIQTHPEDVEAIQQVAQLHMERGWYEEAIGPLARALQLDPTRRSLWVSLDEAVEKSGWAKITDAELVRRAAAFIETVEMWGHGC